MKRMTFWSVRGLWPGVGHLEADSACAVCGDEGGEQKCYQQAADAMNQGRAMDVHGKLLQNVQEMNEGPVVCCNFNRVKGWSY